MAGILETLAQKEVFLGVAFGVFVLVILILRVFEKKIGTKAPESRQSEYASIGQEIDTLLRQKGQEETTLQDIDKLLRRLYARAYAVPFDLEYAEIAAFCREHNQTTAADLADKLLEYTYAGESLDNYKITVLLSMLKKIANEQETKERMQKLHLPIPNEEKKSSPQAQPQLPQVQPSRIVQPQQVPLQQQAPQAQPQASPVKVSIPVQQIPQKTALIQQSIKQEPPKMEEPQELHPVIAHPEKVHLALKKFPSKKTAHTHEHPIKVLDNLDRIRAKMPGQRNGLM